MPDDRGKKSFAGRLVQWSAGWLCGIAVAGCFPALAHPTRVEPGLRLGAVLGASFGTDSGDSGDLTHVVIPSIDLELALGIRDTSRAGAAGLRIAGMAGFRGLGASLYAEAPRPWLGGLDAGLGFAAHHGQMKLRMPYVQFGGANGSGSSWFIRNGLAWVADRDSSRWNALWVPSVGFWRRFGGHRDGAVWVSGVIGHQPRIERDCFFFECFSGSSSFLRTSVIFGMTYSLPLGASP